MGFCPNDGPEYDKSLKRTRGPHPLVAAALSVIWPGLGHFGHRNRRALILLSGSLAASAVLVAYVSTRSKTTLLTWTVTRSPLWITIVVAGLVLVFRIWVVVDAYMVGLDPKTAHCGSIERSPRSRSLFWPGSSRCPTSSSCATR